jgi:hypothetical protein
VIRKSNPNPPFTLHEPRACHDGFHTGAPYSSQESGIHFDRRVGVSTAVFSVVDRILFHGLPYAQQERLVSLGLVAPIEAQEFMLGADYVLCQDVAINPLLGEAEADGLGVGVGREEPTPALR